ncbi:ABC transporter substrate-binding protein [Geobacter sp. OR-1]|uniref:ABC transporter substrate-binding protein n=1 Tax=Geobacter sp. OR-1 TaxID=1266765 RepID=UPI0005A61D12|nr:ABC transporter substrate binding protein [Geobacter sp. OR-1]
MPASKKPLSASIKIYTPTEVKGRLKSIVEREEAKVVIALGKESLAEAITLPPSISVIFDLVVTPPQVKRQNMTGFYLATPVRPYAELLKNNLQSIRRIAVVGSREQLSLLAREQIPLFNSYSVRSPYELVDTVRQLDEADAILLLPDTSLLTTAAMDEAYLLSFRRGIPLLGISERHVKQGALLALVVDMVGVGRTIGEYATKALHGVNIGQFPPAPGKRFELYLNTETARRMKISLPEQLVRTAKRVFP